MVPRPQEDDPRDAGEPPKPRTNVGEMTMEGQFSLVSTRGGRRLAGEILLAGLIVGVLTLWIGPLALVVAAALVLLPLLMIGVGNLTLWVMERTGELDRALDKRGVQEEAEEGDVVVEWEPRGPS